MIDQAYYFHVTHLNLLGKIDIQGINPKYSQGKRKACWYVREDCVRSAMLHVAFRHSWLVGQLVILKVEFMPFQLIHSAWDGVFSTTYTKAHSAAFGAGDFIPDWREL